MLFDAPQSVQQTIIPAGQWIMRYCTDASDVAGNTWTVETAELQSASLDDIATWFFTECTDNNYAMGYLTCVDQPKTVIKFDLNHPKCLIKAKAPVTRKRSKNSRKGFK